jgi:hypothetical protein
MVIRDLNNQVDFDGDVNVDDDLTVSGLLTAEGGVTVGGAGQDAELQLKAASGSNTLFLGSSASEATILVGGVNRSGRVQLFDDDGTATIDLRADQGILNVGSASQDGDLTVLGSGGAAITLDGDGPRLTLRDGGNTAITLDGQLGVISVGGVGEDGTIDVRDEAGEVTILLRGDVGLVECDDLDETGVKLGAARQPVHDALARVLALDAVAFRAAGAAGPGTPRIGLLGGDVEQVCPELVATVGEGRKGVNYGRLSVLLAAAVKEQQRLIDRQAAELAGLMERIERIETRGAA